MKSKKWLWLMIPVVVGLFFLLNPEKRNLNQKFRAQNGESYISLSEGITHYRISGPPLGEPVILVHGATIPIWTWDQLEEELAASGFRVISYDCYGRGYSDRPRGNYDRKRYMTQLFELQDSLCQGGPVHLVGLSLGGALAAAYTEAWPDRVDKLVLISPVINNFPVNPAFRTPVLGELTAPNVGIRVVFSRFKNLLAENPALDRYIGLFEEQTRFRGFQRSLLSLLRNDALDDYDEVYRSLGKSPREIMLIWGTEDEEIQLPMIEDLRSYIPYLEFQPLEGDGHGLVMNDPRRVNPLVREFLSRYSGTFFPIS